jgi:chloramphenicol O-acetyltransferase
VESSTACHKAKRLWWQKRGKVFACFAIQARHAVCGCHVGFLVEKQQNYIVGFCIN